MSGNGGATEKRGREGKWKRGTWASPEVTAAKAKRDLQRFPVNEKKGDT